MGSVGPAAGGINCGWSWRKSRGVFGGKGERRGRGQEVPGKGWHPEKGNQQLGVGGAPHEGMLAPDDAELGGALGSTEVSSGQGGV